MDIDENVTDEDEFDTGKEFDLGLDDNKSSKEDEHDEDKSNEEKPASVPETNEEPERTFTRSGGRRASNLNREVASKEVPAGNKLAETKLIENKIVIKNFDEVYTIDPDAKTYTIKTAKGEKTFTFEEMNEFVSAYRGANRIHKPMSVLAYTDYKHHNLKNWNVVSGTGLTEDVSRDDADDDVSVDVDMLYDRANNKKIRLHLKGISEITPEIKNALINDFEPPFRSDINGKIYSQDIKIGQDLWLTYIDCDEASNTLNFVLDGKMPSSTSLDESTDLKEANKAFNDIEEAIENATDVAEIEAIINSIEDEATSQEMINTLHASVADNDNLETIIGLMLSIYEDNMPVEE